MLLLATYKAFSARSHRKSFRKAGWRLLWVAVGLFVYTAVGFAVLAEEFVPKATLADMITEFLCRLVFTSSGNIEPDSTSAEVFVNSIGAVWLIAVVVTAIGLLYSSRRPASSPRPTPACGRCCASTSRRTSSGCSRGRASTCGSPTTAGPPSATRSSARWRCAWPIPSGRPRSGRPRCAVRRLLLQTGLDPVPLRGEPGVRRPRAEPRVEGRRGRRGQRDGAGAASSSRARRTRTCARRSTRPASRTSRSR